MVLPQRRGMEAIVERLKRTPCPHCKVVGTLIRHGFLYGFDESSPQRKTLRARRIVLYLALIAFLGACCRGVIQSADVCYTDNLVTANRYSLPAQSITPHPAQKIFLIPRHYPAPPPWR